MVAVNTTVEINCDGTWVPGVVIAESSYRLVVAVGGDRTRRAYIARLTSNWRTVPAYVNAVRDSRRRKAIVQAHNVFRGDMMRLKQTDAGALVPDPDHWTVEEAADFLVGLPAPLTRQQLGKLGKDCSMVCRIRNIGWTIRPTPNKPWPNERAYTQAIILEVFRANPDTRSYVPGIHTERVQ